MIVTHSDTLDLLGHWKSTLNFWMDDHHKETFFSGIWDSVWVFFPVARGWAYFLRFSSIPFLYNRKKIKPCNVLKIFLKTLVQWLIIKMIWWQKRFFSIYKQILLIVTACFSILSPFRGCISFPHWHRTIVYFITSVSCYCIVSIFSSVQWRGKF